MINTVQIYVDCIENDPVDVRCGGPEYLGFDFYVPETEKESMIEFIKDQLQEMELPLKNIYCGESSEQKENKIWTKERIIVCLEKHADEIRSEAIHRRKMSLRVR